MTLQWIGSRFGFTDMCQRLDQDTILPKFRIRLAERRQAVSYGRLPSLWIHAVKLSCRRGGARRGQGHPQTAVGPWRGPGPQVTCRNPGNERQGASLQVRAQAAEPDRDASGRARGMTLARPSRVEDCVAERRGPEKPLATRATLCKFVMQQGLRRVRAAGLTGRQESVLPRRPHCQELPSLRGKRADMRSRVELGM